MEQRKIRLADITLRTKSIKSETTLTFREKIETARLLDKLHIDAIETPALGAGSAGMLFMHTIAPLLKYATLCCPITVTDPSSPATTWEALRDAKRPRMQINLPTSTVGMEYICKKKPKVMLEYIKELVTECKSYCNDVEFVALDATRSEFSFLCEAIRAAVAAGATVITIDDTAGDMLVYNFGEFISNLKASLPELDGVTLAVCCTNDYFMAAASAYAAMRAGADEIKVSVSSAHFPSIKGVTGTVNVKGAELGVYTDTNRTELDNIVKQIKQLINEKKHDFSPTAQSGADTADGLSDIKPDADYNEVCAMIKRIGYDLGDEDKSRVYEAFKKLACKKKTRISSKELDVIISTEALQGPSEYTLATYVINSGNVFPSTASIELEKTATGERVRGLAAGDGPVDAAFHAVEQIIGSHYELDDFQIQSVTEGRGAVGEAVVRLRADGKLYSGRGISTDIVGAGIRAYVNAYNKILCEQKG